MLLLVKTRGYATFEKTWDEHQPSTINQVKKRAARSHAGQILFVFIYANFIGIFVVFLVRDHLKLIKPQLTIGSTEHCHDIARSYSARHFFDAGASSSCVHYEQFQVAPASSVLGGTIDG